MKKILALLALSLLFPAFHPARTEVPEQAFRPPQVLSTVEASYPATAVQGGTVVLEVTISKSGEIARIQVRHGAEGFTPQALKAIRKWKFAPATFEGRPVEASIPVAFSFSQPLVWWGNRKP